MRIVDVAEAPPGYCAVLGRSDGPYIDTGSSIPEYDPRVYVSLEAVKEMAKMIGMVPEEQYNEALDLNTGLEAACNDLEAELKEANRELDAVEFLQSKRVSKVGV